MNPKVWLYFFVIMIYIMGVSILSMNLLYFRPISQDLLETCYKLISYYSCLKVLTLSFIFSLLGFGILNAYLWLVSLGFTRISLRLISLRLMDLPGWTFTDLEEISITPRSLYVFSFHLIIPAHSQRKYWFSFLMTPSLHWLEIYCQRP